MADRSVRPARPDDLAGLVSVQRSVATALGLPTEAESEALLARWRHVLALREPPLVLVALEGLLVVGMALADRVRDDPATAESTAESTGKPPRVAELLELGVLPGRRLLGHGSRLLTALADHAREAGADGLLAWIPEQADLLATFVAGAGWSPDGASRVLANEAGAELTEARWRTWFDCDVA